MGTTWTYNDIPDGTDLAPARLPDDERARLQGAAWSWIVQGRDDAGDFASYMDDEEDITEAELVALYEGLLAVRRAQQEGFGTVTSNLTAAFDELNEAGVVARQDFACCGSCAAAEIHDERDDSRHWKGWIWYHQQDTESLLDSEDGSVYIGYGAYPAEDFDEAAYEKLKKKQKIAIYEQDVRTLLDATVFPIFARHGLGVHWDGDLDTRILLTGANFFEPV